MTARIGFDLGNVIFGGKPDIFDDDFLATPEVPGASENVSLAVSMLGAGGVFFISKCFARVEQRSREWLAHDRFFERTGATADNLVFCRNILDKAAIAAELGLTAFTDDRPAVLVPMAGNVPLRICLNPKPDELSAHRFLLGDTRIVPNHLRVRELLRQHFLAFA